MKIVHCFYSLTIGGAEILAIDLLNEMCKVHEASLIIVNNKWNANLLKQLDPKVKVHFINRGAGSRNPWPIIKFNLLLLSINPHIIHCHEPNMGQIIFYRKPRLLYTIHDTGISTALYTRYHTLIAISDAVFKDVSIRYHAVIKKIYNGIDTSNFKRRTDHLLNGNTCRLVQISRMIHQKKGQDILLRILADIKSRHSFYNFTLDFVGIGPSMEYLKNLVIELGLQKEVTFVGEKDRPWLFNSLSTYHILVQPSRFEGFGLTILEGFAAGLPVLASQIEGPAEIIKQTPRGFLFPSEAITEGADTLFEIISAFANGGMQQLMQTTQPISDTIYSIKQCAQQYLEEYNLLLTR